MISAIAVGNYRSLLKLVVPLGRLNVITGRNGSGKSNLFRVLRLLADTAQGGIIHSLAREGGMASTLWAGPEKLSRAMKTGRVPIQGGMRSEPVRLRLGFADETFGYAITLGFPPPSDSAFGLDPEIKCEAIWTGPVYEARRLLVDRRAGLVKVRGEAGWQIVSEQLNGFESIFS
jgi:predicted ATPase